jgi:hypothetical protein
VVLYARVSFTLVNLRNILFSERYCDAHIESIYIQLIGYRKSDVSSLLVFLIIETVMQIELSSIR